MTAQNHRIKNFIMESGERYCLLIDEDSGVPTYYPNLYVTSQVRNCSLSLSAMASALSGINVLLSFCRTNQIDLEYRLLMRDFFKLHELDALRDFCQLRFSKAPRESQNVELKPSKAKSSVSRQSSGLASEYMRLTHAAKYTEWLAKVMMSNSPDRNFALDLVKMRKGIESRRPATKGRNQLGYEKGLTRAQVAVLLDVIRIGSDSNPFDDQAIQTRNRALVLLLIYLGIRSGELLNIRASDIDWSRNHIIIARRADEKKDPRAAQPLVKTLDRRIPMKDTLVESIREYITKYRNKVPNARRHDYLLVTHKSGPTQGQPLSRSTYIKVINEIARAVPELIDMHGHELRHTWNNEFSELMDQMDTPPSPEEQERHRSYLQGWKEGSGSAAVYTRRFVREKALEAGLQLQEKITRRPRDLP